MQEEGGGGHIDVFTLHFCVLSARSCHCRGVNLPTNALSRVLMLRTDPRAHAAKTRSVPIPPPHWCCFPAQRGQAVVTQSSDPYNKLPQWRGWMDERGWEGVGGGRGLGALFFGEAAESLAKSSSSDLYASVASSLCCLHLQDWFRAARQ